MIDLKMSEAPNGVDPRVWIDGVEVTGRVASIELLPEGWAQVRLFLTSAENDQRLLPQPRQIVQQKYQVV
jgi:hypothetical protein